MPSFVGIETASADSSVTTLACNVPASTQDGDILIACCIGGADPGSVAGLTELLYGKIASGDPNTVGVHYRVASSEPASYTFNFNSSHAVAVIATYRYMDSTLLPPSIIDQGPQTGSTDVNCPAGGPTGAGQMCVRIAGANAENDAVSPVVAPSGFTLRGSIQCGTGGGDDYAIFLADKLIPDTSPEAAAVFDTSETANVLGWGSTLFIPHGGATGGGRILTVAP